jgi:hypothetical protein
MIRGIVAFPVSKEEVPMCQKGCLQILAHLTLPSFVCKLSYVLPLYNHYTKFDQLGWKGPGLVVFKNDVLQVHPPSNMAAVV